MNIDKIKLIYSEKNNQFYKPIRLDEDIGTIYMKVVKNRYDNSITKKDIIHIEENDRYKFIVMYNSKITAEDHFIDVMDSEYDIKIKIAEIKNFKKNLLDESEKCMNTLIKLSNNKKSKIKNVALSVYRSLNKANLSKKDITEYNLKSYENQVIPNQIIKLALSKRLFIERSDDYYYNTKLHKLIVATNNVKYSIQMNHPCGFLIRDKGGNIIAGKIQKYKYTLSVQDVIEFVDEYDEKNTPRYKTLHKVPMSLIKEKKLKDCRKILQEYGMHYKNEHNYFFWVLDKHHNVVAGGENGFGFKYLLKYCRRLRSQPKKSVTDKILTSD